MLRIENEYTIMESSNVTQSDLDGNFEDIH